MWRIVRGSTVERFDTLPEAVSAWTRTVIAHPRDHAVLIEGDELPGMPPTVVAERFGNPEPQLFTPPYTGP